MLLTQQSLSLSVFSTSCPPSPLLYQGNDDNVVLWHYEVMVVDKSRMGGQAEMGIEGMFVGKAFNLKNGFFNF